MQEEEILKLNQRTRSLNERQKSNKVVVPELEELVRCVYCCSTVYCVISNVLTRLQTRAGYNDDNCRLPLATLERELCLSSREVETLIEAINSTMEESRKIERDLISIQVP